VQVAGVARVPRRVLIVEDNVDVAETTATMLTLAGHNVRWAADGAQALVAAQEFAPEVVLLDIGLPVVDGYQVAKRLRQVPATRQALLVGLTGYGQQGDRQRGREAGFDHHLLKPADPGALCALIEGWSPTQTAGAAAVEDDAVPAKTAHLYTFKRP
jgi:CheY-like chemotaxis protein